MIVFVLLETLLAAVESIWTLDIHKYTIYFVPLETTYAYYETKRSRFRLVKYV